MASDLSVAAQDFADECHSLKLDDAQLTQILERADSIWQEEQKNANVALVISREGLALASKSRGSAKEAQRMGEELVTRLQETLRWLQVVERQNKHAERLFQTRVKLGAAPPQSGSNKC